MSCTSIYTVTVHWQAHSRGASCACTSCVPSSRSMPSWWSWLSDSRCTVVARVISDLLQGHPQWHSVFIKCILEFPVHMEFWIENVCNLARCTVTARCGCHVLNIGRLCRHLKMRSSVWGASWGLYTWTIKDSEVSRFLCTYSKALATVVTTSIHSGMPLASATQEAGCWWKELALLCHPASMSTEASLYPARPWPFSSML